jgi:hypothetical protein
MTVLERGRFQLNLGFLQLAGDVTEQDRQCAWELYTEITTRLALVGKPEDPDCADFTGEILSESLDSVHKFFGEARNIMHGLRNALIAKYRLGDVDKIAAGRNTRKKSADFYKMYRKK